MRTNTLFLRCLAERKGGKWQAFCLDLSLAAQGSDLEEVKAKLDAQIREYLYDALVGQDREHADYLLKHRKSPPSLWLRYYIYLAICKLRPLVKPRTAAQPFESPMPLAPAC